MAAEQLAYIAAAAVARVRREALGDRVEALDRVAEPIGRDTCAAVTLGAALVGARSTTGVMAVYAGMEGINAGHILTASVLGAPADVLQAKCDFAAFYDPSLTSFRFADFNRREHH